MATDPVAANEAFNITNGDLLRWEELWPRIAACFDMPLGPRQQIDLAETMADKAPLWSEIVARHGLQSIPYEQVVAWPYGDFVFQAGFDIISSMTKARLHGWTEVIDTEAMFLRRMVSRSPGVKAARPARGSDALMAG